MNIVFGLEYEETIFTDDVKIVGPQMYAKRVCTKCNKVQILVGTKVEEILIEEEKKTTKKL